MKLQRFLIFLVGISIPFNNVAPVPNYSLGLISSAFYFLSMVPRISVMKNLGKYYGKSVWNVLAFIVLFTIVNALNHSRYNTPIFPFSEFMCNILMLFLLVHCLYDRKALWYCLYGLAFGGILMTVFFTIGVGVKIGEDFRLVMFGENSNVLGVYMGLSSIVILNDFILNDELKFGKYRFLFYAAFVPIVSLLFATGSRTAFLTLSISIILILALYPTKSIFTKIVFMTVGISCCVYVFDKLEESDAILIQRLATTVEDGNTSGRDEITDALIPYVMESPIFGYGQTGYVDVAKKALGKVSVFGDVVYGYSPHNVIMEVLLYTGIIGLILWLTFWWNVFKESWILYHKRRFIMPGLMCIPILACIFSGQLLTAKWAYILYAYIMSEYYFFRISRHN